MPDALCSRVPVMMPDTLCSRVPVMMPEALCSYPLILNMMRLCDPLLAIEDHCHPASWVSLHHTTTRSLCELQTM